MAFLPCKSLLLLANVGIVLGIVWQVVELRRAKHSMRSWSASFYALSFVWLMFRSVFWFLTIVTSQSWDPALFYILYWTPNPIQFGAFLLLPLFFAQIAHRKTWRSGWKYIKPLYVAFTVGASIFIIVWSVVAAVRDRQMATLCRGAYHGSDGSASHSAGDHLRDPHRHHHGSSPRIHPMGLSAPWSGHADSTTGATLGIAYDGAHAPVLRGARATAGHYAPARYVDDDDAGYDDDYPSYGSATSAECIQAQVSTAVFRAVSASCFFVLAIAMAYFSVTMRRLRSWQYSSTAALRLTPKELAFTNVSLFAIFFCRGLYQAGSAMHLWYMPEVPLHGDADISPALLFVFIAWDVLPTLLILMTVHTRSGALLPSHGSLSFRTAYGSDQRHVRGASAKPELPAGHSDAAFSRRGSHELPDYGLFGRLKEDEMAIGVYDAALLSAANPAAPRMLHGERPRLGEPYHAREDGPRVHSTIDEHLSYNDLDPLARFVRAVPPLHVEAEASAHPERRARKKRRRNRQAANSQGPFAATSGYLSHPSMGSTGSVEGPRRGPHSISSTDSSSSLRSGGQWHQARGWRIGSIGFTVSSAEDAGYRADAGEQRWHSESSAAAGGEAGVLPLLHSGGVQNTGAYGRGAARQGSFDSFEVSSLPPSGAKASTVSASSLCDLAAAERSYSVALAEQQRRQRISLATATEDDDLLGSALMV